MAWENRNRSDRYYYAGRKVHGAVIKEYLGRGIAAALIAATLLKQKEHRHALWKNRRTLLHSLQAIHRRIRSFLRYSRQIQRLHRFIQRDARERILEALSQAEYPMPNQIEEPVLLPTAPAIDETINRATHGDIQILPQLRQLIEQKPLLWQQMTDLARQAQEAQLNALAGENETLKAAILTEFNALKKELGDGTSNPLEQIIIERILISWLQVQHTDLLFAKTPASDSRLTKLLQIRTDQCQGRLQRAITQLQAMRTPKQPQKRKQRAKKCAVSLASE